MNYLFKVVDDNLCDVCVHVFLRTGSVFTNRLLEALIESTLDNKNLCICN